MSGLDLSGRLAPPADGDAAPCQKRLAGTRRVAIRSRHGRLLNLKLLLRWSIPIFRAKLQWLGNVKAANEAEAIAKGAEEFGQDAKRLMAIRRAERRLREPTDRGRVGRG